jgi:hypothetical protein
MGKGSNIVHQYFTREFDGYKLLVKVNPIEWTGVEIARYADGRVETREIVFDEDILEDLEADGFQPANPLEFNLYLNGLA